MSAPLDLHQIEKKVYRATYEDGLWDIYAGGIIASMSILASEPEEDTARWLNYGFFFLGMVISVMVYHLGKNLLQPPRMGQVTFGPRRKRRKAILAIILGIIVGVQTLIVITTIIFWHNPGLAEQLGIVVSQPNTERLLVAVIGAMFVGPSMALVAYFNDFLRGYYIAILMSLAVFLYIWFRSPLLLLVAAVLIFIPGLVLFIRFLLTHPLPPSEVRYGE